MACIQAKLGIHIQQQSHLPFLLDGLYASTSPALLVSVVISTGILQLVLPFPFYLLEAQTATLFGKQCCHLEEEQIYDVPMRHFRLVLRFHSCCWGRCCWLAASQCVTVPAVSVVAFW